jgi:hypothetical protein
LLSNNEPAPVDPSAQDKANVMATSRQRYIYPGRYLPGPNSVVPIADLRYHWLEGDELNLKCLVCIQEPHCMAGSARRNDEQPTEAKGHMFVNDR